LEEEEFTHTDPENWRRRNSLIQILTTWGGGKHTQILRTGGGGIRTHRS